MRRCLGLFAALLCALAAVLAAPTAASAATTETFNYTGAPQTWTVPYGVTSASFDVYGAQGRGFGGQFSGGLGGRAIATFAVTPQAVVRVNVGGQGGPNAGGFNGGGTAINGGGGATDVRMGGTALTNRVLIAGGGGGTSSCAGAAFAGGGAGSGFNGFAGSDPQCGATPGGGGTQSAGGSVGGTLGQGGSVSGFSGGGGGGGYYGGGAGSNGGPGGGGSGYGPPGYGWDSSVRSGNGLATITYTQETRNLDVAIPFGPGQGYINSSPAGIGCGNDGAHTDCQEDYGQNTPVALTAHPGPGSTFTGWGGDCSGTSTTCTVTMSQARSVQASFGNGPRTLSVTKPGNGSGTVTSEPAGVDCGSTCSADYALGTSVTLTAHPGPGSTFTGWGGDCSGTSTTCTITMSQARSVQASFDNGLRTLSVSKPGNGSGSVTSSPAGISCGSTCSADYALGTSVILTASAASSSDFTGWSGGGCAGTSTTCTVAMNQARSVEAYFTLPVQAGVTNGGFETGDLSGWTTAGVPNGAATVETSFTCPHGNCFNTTVSPVEGSKFALLTPGDAGVYATVSQTFRAEAGEKISGQARFLSQAATNTSNFNDQAQVVIKDASNNKVIAFSAQSSTNSTPWTYWQRTFSVAGTYTVEASVKNVDDNISLSRLALDKVSLEDADTTPPQLNMPADITEQATGPAGAQVRWQAPTATDEDPAHPDVSCSPASGSTFAIGTTTVNCSATDATGNKASDSFTVKVQDTAGPNITNVPSDITEEATGSAGATVTFTKPTATDAVDGGRTVNCSPDSGSTFPLGTTEVTCSASDTRGNTSMAKFNVTVRDTTRPVLGLPDDKTVEATGASGAEVNYTATANDAVDGSIGVNCTPASGSTFALTTTTVNCSANDAAGNTAQASFKVTVVDTTAPSVVVSHTTDGTNGWNKTSPVTLNVSASDSGSGLAGAAPTCTDGPTALTLTASPTAAGNWTASVSRDGTHHISCSVSDKATNKTTKTDTVNIDANAPTISNLGPTTSATNGWYNTDVTNAFRATDSGSGLNDACITAFQANQAGDNVQSKTTTGEGTALKVTSDGCTDEAGNTTQGIDSANFKVDKTVPTVPTGVSATAVASPVVTWTPSTDSVGATKYNIKRSTTLGGTYTTVGSVTGTPPTASFTDNTAGPSTTYYYKVNAEDAATYASADSSASSPITTPGTSDTTAPTLTSTSPSAPNGTIGTMLNRSDNVTAKFSEDVHNVNATTFKLEQVTLNKKGVETSVSVAATVTPASGTVAQGASATLNPSKDLQRGSTYRATLTNGVTDTAGNPLASYSWKFKLN